jgi:ATP-dependent RNA helicase DeaD
MSTKTQAFSALEIPAPLAQAIAARGYERATAVQVAVAGAEHAGRDLLVSSETGSGKTLAFGLALAEGLLAEGPARDHRPAGPRALVVTPTRELATQVRNELQWLFARTSVRLGVFTGGTDVRGDLAQLRPGVDLVVGTPGRLVDLLGRRSLRLDAVRTVVLDEADEMLDMGFREDLETLLAARAATVEGGREDRTRTLMFSATLPEPILALAARYQHDAVRIDARTRQAGGAASAGHQDITYVAHLVAMGEKLPALVNVLRRHRGVRAIVFGTTRDGVAELHQQLVNRGFRAVVLSGDRAQSERTRALAALRGGDADLLVATNVAARGLDLPEVDLVVHADLPLNAEALTHRSGRTGRAGRKGTSVLLATVAERRKAERLLGAARVAFAWTPAPDSLDIARAAESELGAELLGAARDSDGPEAATARELASRLAAEAGADALLVALLRRELARLPAGEPLSEVDVRPRAPAKSGPRPSHGDFSRAAALFEINLGKSQKAEPGWLLPLICRRGGVTRREVGAIRVGPQSSQFEIAGEAAAEFALASGEPDPRAPHVRIRRIDSAPHRPSAAARGAPHRPRGAEVKSDGHGAWRPPARRPPPAPRKAGSRRPPRHR